LRFLVF